MTTLYLKYRPQKISDLDLSDVRDLLSKIVASKNIPHAFLFEGPRGSGKTSAARILAKVLNCENLSKDNEPCNKCDQCLSTTKGTNIDVIELDAASHRGIDDVRLIRESVKLAPAKANKKVYIIDEAHMLTTEASNALLKTLEEPPKHVVFILATTNPEKLLDTIRSRTLIVNFKKAVSSEIVSSLTKVLEKENKKFDNEVLDLISKNVDGSFRDAKKILEEMIINDALADIQKAEKYLLNKADFDVSELFEFLSKKDGKSSIALLINAEEKGVSVKSVYGQMILKLKDMLFSAVGYKNIPNIGFNKQEAIALTETVISSWNEYNNDVSEYMPIYLAVAKWCGEEKNVDGKKIVTNVVKKDDSEESKAGEDPGSNEGKITANENPNKVTDTPKNDYKYSGEKINDDAWKNILTTIREKNASTEALLRASKPMDFNGQKLLLGVYYKFHKEKLESVPHKLCLEDCLKNILGADIKVECILTEPEKKSETVDAIGLNTVNQNGMVKSAESVMLSETQDDKLVKLADEVFGN